MDHGVESVHGGHRLGDRLCVGEVGYEGFGVVQLPHDRSGALLSMLEQFSARGVNLTRIESRPVGDSLGRYRFSIDAEGHIREERLQAAFIGLHRTCPVVRFLGSYPRLDARPVVVPAGTSDKDFVVARSWVADVLAGRTL